MIYCSKCARLYQAGAVENVCLCGNDKLKIIYLQTLYSHFTINDISLRARFEKEKHFKLNSLSPKELLEFYMKLKEDKKSWQF